jgi:hypothetical protein
MIDCAIFLTILLTLLVNCSTVLVHNIFKSTLVRSRIFWPLQLKVAQKCNRFGVDILKSGDLLHVGNSLHSSIKQFTMFFYFLAAPRGQIDQKKRGIISI